MAIFQYKNGQEWLWMAKIPISYIDPIFSCLREAIKKNYEILDIVQKGGGGVSAAAKLFIDERYGHVYRGGEVVRAPRPN